MLEVFVFENPFRYLASLRRVPNPIVTVVCSRWRREVIDFMYSRNRQSAGKWIAFYEAGVSFNDLPLSTLGR
jgi:hypothetical protein